MKIFSLVALSLSGFMLLSIFAFSGIDDSLNKPKFEMTKCCKAAELAIQIDDCQAQIIRYKVSFTKEGDQLVKNLEFKLDSLRSEMNSLNIPANVSIGDCCFKAICSNFKRPADDEIFTLMLHVIREYSSMIARSSDFYIHKTKDGLYRVDHNKKHVHLQLDDFKRFEKAISHIDSVYSSKLLAKRNEIFSSLAVDYSEYTELHYEVISWHYSTPENYPLLNDYSVFQKQDFYLEYVQQKDSVYNLFIR
jgi:hypothetical protein